MLDVSGAGLFHHVFLGGAATDLTQLARDAVIVPHGEEGLYAIYEGGSARVFVDFSDFAAALATRLAAQGALVRSVSGTGRFDASSAEFAAAFCTVCVR